MLSSPGNNLQKTTGKRLLHMDPGTTFVQECVKDPDTLENVNVYISKEILFVI